jgi:hypothetical protein
VTEKKPKQLVIALLRSGHRVPVSGLWRLDHTPCSENEEMWFHKHEIFPVCSSCGCSGIFHLVEEVRHISEDPDFQ